MDNRDGFDDDKGLPAAAVRQFPEIFRGTYGANNAKARRWLSSSDEYADGTAQLTISNSETKRKVI